MFVLGFTLIWARYMFERLKSEPESIFLNRFVSFCWLLDSEYWVLCLNETTVFAFVSGTVVPSKTKIAYHFSTLVLTYGQQHTLQIEPRDEYGNPTSNSVSLVDEVNYSVHIHSVRALYHLKSQLCAKGGAPLSNGIPLILWIRLNSLLLQGTRICFLHSFFFELNLAYWRKHVTCANVQRTNYILLIFLVKLKAVRPQRAHFALYAQILFCWIEHIKKGDLCKCAKDKWHFVDFFFK